MGARAATYWYPRMTANWQGGLPTKCQWIEGEPHHTDACKCMAPVAEAKPYCTEHCARAYGHIRDPLADEFGPGLLPVKAPKEPRQPRATPAYVAPSRRRCTPEEAKADRERVRALQAARGRMLRYQPHVPVDASLAIGEREQAIAARWNGHQSAGTIASEMKTSKGTVAGALHRIRQRMALRQAARQAAE